MQSIASVAPALRAAGFVGVWNTNVAAGQSTLDEGSAALLAGNPSLAGQPIPLEVAFASIHPDDRKWVFERISRVRQTGGPFSAEFRVLTSEGHVRWILNRGTLTLDGRGAMHGAGIYLDTTDSRSSPFILDAYLNQKRDDSLNRAADLCIRTHTALKTSGYPDLRRLSETLLLSIGRALAQRRD